MQRPIEQSPYISTIIIIGIFISLALATPPTAHRSSQLGTIANRYKLIRVLGAGAHGKVFKALDMESNEMVAIKRSASNAAAQQLAQIEAEMIQWALCKSGKGIVRMRNHFRCGEQQYCLVLELMSCDLKKAAIKFGRVPPTVRLKQVQKIAQNILPVLALLAKKGIVHSDIKMRNILYDELRNEFKLADFGLSFNHLPSKNRFQGTLQYLAPESYAYDQMSPATDMWAFGLTLLNSFLSVSAFAVKGNELADFKAGIVPRWEYWLGRMPDALRGRFSFLGFQIMPDNNQQPNNLGNLRQTLIKQGGDVDILSSFAKFLERCLDYDPKHRMTAEKALKHPFIRLQIHSDDPIDGFDASGGATNRKKFWRKALKFGRKPQFDEVISNKQAHPLPAAAKNDPIYDLLGAGNGGITRNFPHTKDSNSQNWLMKFSRRQQNHNLNGVNGKFVNAQPSTQPNELIATSNSGTQFYTPRNSFDLPLSAAVVEDASLNVETEQPRKYETIRGKRREVITI